MTKFIVVLSLALAGCSGTSNSTPVESATSGNFHLYVSNQSFDIDPVNIQVYIDGEMIVDGTFRVESQHTWILFDLELEPGEHTLRAVGNNGDAELAETFNISDEHWGAVGFWASPTDAQEPMFTFDVEAEPIVFD